MGGVGCFLVDDCFSSFFSNTAGLDFFSTLELLKCAGGRGIDFPFFVTLELLGFVGGKGILVPFFLVFGGGGGKHFTLGDFPFFFGIASEEEILSTFFFGGGEIFDVF